MESSKRGEERRGIIVPCGSFVLVFEARVAIHDFYSLRDAMWQLHYRHCLRSSHHLDMPALYSVIFACFLWLTLLVVDE